MVILSAKKRAVLIGDLGSGKSTIVEKIAGVKGIQSDSVESATLSAQIYPVSSLLEIVDTPGANAIEDSIGHQLWIAQAMSSGPVDLILIVGVANTRMDNTLREIEDYLIKFNGFNTHYCPLITHMDTVNWSEAQFLAKLKSKYGINRAIFSSINKKGSDLQNEILAKCNLPPLNVKINADNFLKYFAIHDTNLMILNAVNDEVSQFKIINEQFVRLLDNYSHKDKIDLVFEFQAFMNNEITQSQMRVAEKFNFSFYGPESLTETGHIANLTNQLKNVLYDVRMMALNYQNDHGVSQLRKCPHCGEVWTKVIGCDNTTTCGNRPSSVDARSSSFSSYSFAFNNGNLKITKSNNHSISSVNSTVGRGCGRQIVWNSMAPVPLPDELKIIAAVSVDDIQLLVNENKLGFCRFYFHKVKDFVVGTYKNNNYNNNIV